MFKRIRSMFDFISGFLNGSEPEQHMPTDFKAIYIDGIGYIRHGGYIAMCDYTRPAKEWQWKVVDPDTLDDDERDYYLQIAWALAIIEGGVSIRTREVQTGPCMN